MLIPVGPEKGRGLLQAYTLGSVVVARDLGELASWWRPAAWNDNIPNECLPCLWNSLWPSLMGFYELSSSKTVKDADEPLWKLPGHLSVKTRLYTGSTETRHRQESPNCFVDFLLLLLFLRNENRG